ncbi:hypothetical protein HQN89_35310 [Paenibacillus frigoriresistens]|nr:hypothetical protein [Paenibacillus frigoriresistens]
MKKEKELDSKNRIIVIHRGGKEIGIMVDAVDQMFLPQQKFSPPPHLSQNRWLTGGYHHQDLIINKYRRK